MIYSSEETGNKSDLLTLMVYDEHGTYDPFHCPSNGEALTARYNGAMFELSIKDDTVRVHTHTYQGCWRQAYAVTPTTTWRQLLEPVVRDFLYRVTCEAVNQQSYLKSENIYHVH